MIKLLFNKIVKSLLFSAFSFLHILHFSPFIPPFPLPLISTILSPLPPAFSPPWEGLGGGSYFKSGQVHAPAHFLK